MIIYHHPIFLSLQVDRKLENKTYSSTTMAATTSAAHDNHSSAPAAPPPTPSAVPHHHRPSTSDTLSHLFLRLPPSLTTLASPHRSPTPSPAAVTPPLVSLSGDLLAAAEQLGFFHLYHHHPLSAAVVEAESLLRQPPDLSLPWPLGFDEDDHTCTSFSFDPTVPPNCRVAALTELASSLEKLGLEIVEALTAGLRLQNPFRDRSRRSCMMWVSDATDIGEDGGCGRDYPCVVALHCQVSGRRSSMQADSGWVTVAEAAETVLVTIGDIAQVWSDGKLKKVRGRPQPTSNISNSSSSITISLLLTLPMDSIVSPLLSAVAAGGVEDGTSEEDGIEDHKFAVFSFEDYAWRVYNERFRLKDPLLRYRLIN